MTTRANRKTRLQAIMIGRCQGHDIFAAFQPMGIFRFWRNGKFNIFKDVYSPSIFFAPRPPPPCFFRFALASSFLVVLTARSLIEKKKHEKIEGCEQSTFPLTSALVFHVHCHVSLARFLFHIAFQLHVEHEVGSISDSILLSQYSLSSCLMYGVRNGKQIRTARV